MARGVFSSCAVLAAVVAAFALSAGSGSGTETSYRVELDNAFGLTDGGDVRIAGVNAGQTTGFSISDSDPARAVVDIEISEPGFPRFRSDARCRVRQQSLIGEYYLACEPGTSGTRLARGGTIPVEQTASVVPLDLIQNVMRRPYRERLRLIVAELGAGLAGRPEDLSQTIRRAHPGFRETIETLGILARQTRTIQSFVADADRVIADLSENRSDVIRFVREAGQTAGDAARERDALAAQFERLPPFLAELDSTMLGLGNLADAQVPLLTDLRAASAELERFLAELGPFSERALPALESLGDAARAGRRAIRTSREEVRELRRLAAGAGEVGRPLRQFLQTADSRARAIETDRRAARTDAPAFDRESLEHPRNTSLAARGHTGMEALLRYVFHQTLSTNGFDAVSHFVRTLAIEDPLCAEFAAEPDRRTIERCNSYLGPNQPGVENATGEIGGRQFGSADPDPTEALRRRLQSELVPPRGGARRAATRGAARRAGAGPAPGPRSPPRDGVPHSVLDFLMAP